MSYMQMGITYHWKTYKLFTKKPFHTSTSLLLQLYRKAAQIFEICLGRTELCLLVIQCNTLMTNGPVSWAKNVLCEMVSTRQCTDV